MIVFENVIHLVELIHYQIRYHWLVALSCLHTSLRAFLNLRMSSRSRRKLMRGAAISSTDSPQLLFFTTMSVIKYLSRSCLGTVSFSSDSSYYIRDGERPACLGDFLLYCKFLNIGLHYLLASSRISMSLIVEQSANLDSGFTSVNSSRSNAKIVAISFSVPSSLVG